MRQGSSDRRFADFMRPWLWTEDRLFQATASCRPNSHWDRLRFGRGG
jgi:hypothetical protein